MVVVSDLQSHLAVGWGRQDGGPMVVSAVVGSVVGLMGSFESGR